MDFATALRDGVRSYFCSVASTTESIWGLLNQVVPPGSVGPFPVDAASAIQNGAGVGVGLFCNTPPVPPPLPNFTGGQCPGAPYRVTVRADRVQNGIILSSESDAGNGTGPISAAGITGEGTRSGTQFFTDVNGTTTIGILNQTGAPDILWELGDITILRLDGLPDDCGDPAAPFPPLPPGVVPGQPEDIEFDDDQGNPQIIPVNINLGFAYINGSLELNVPVKVNFDTDVDLFADINVTTGDINFRFGGGQSSPCELPPSPPDIADPPVPPEEEETATPIVAIVVNVTNIDPNVAVTQIGQMGGNPDVWAPDLGLVNFLCLTTGSGSSSGWTPDIRVKNTDTIIPCPVPWGAIRVAGTPRPGVTWTLTPVRANISISEFPT